MPSRVAKWSRVVALVGWALLSASGAAAQAASSEEVFEALYAATFVDSMHGWAVGRNSAILRTDDGGATWRVQHRSVGGEERELVAVAFADLDHGVAVGKKGLVMTTADGGDTWTPTARVRSGIRETLEDQLAQIEEGFAVRRAELEASCEEARARPAPTPQADAVPAEPDECQELYKAIVGYEARVASLRENIDSASEFVPASVMQHREFKAVQALGGSAFIAVSGRGFLRSDDFGATWEPLGQEPRQARTCWFADANRGWVVGWSGYVGRTEDGGRTWREASVPEPWVLDAVFFRDDKTGWVGGESGTLFATVDGGASWKKLRTGTSQSIREIRWLDDYVGFLVTWEGVLHTFDAGANWSPVPLPEDAAEWTSPNQTEMPAPLGVARLGPSSAVLVGTWGLVLRTDDGGESWRAMRSAAKAEKDTVEAQGGFANSRWGMGAEFGYVQPAGKIFDRFGPGMYVGMDFFGLRGRIKIGAGYNVNIMAFREKIMAPPGEIKEDEAVEVEGSGVLFHVPLMAQILLFERHKLVLLGVFGVGFVYHGFMIGDSSQAVIDEDSEYDRGRIGVGATQAIVLAWVNARATRTGLKKTISRFVPFLKLGIQESWTWNIEGVQTDLGKKDDRDFGTELWPFLNAGVAIYE